MGAETYDVLVELARYPEGVSMIESHQFLRTGEIQIPDWAIPLGAQPFFCSNRPVAGSGPRTARWLQLQKRFLAARPPHGHHHLSRLPRRSLCIAGGEINANVRFEKLEDVDRKFDLVINCAGIGARDLVQDADLQPHRGQVAIVPKIDDLFCAIVCDDAPLMYAIPARTIASLAEQTKSATTRRRSRIDNANRRRVQSSAEHRQTACSRRARRPAPIPKIRRAS